MARNSEPLYLKLSDALAEQIMDFVKIVPTGNIAAMMQLLAGESVYRIMRLRLANDESMLLETNTRTDGDNYAPWGAARW